MENVKESASIELRGRNEFEDRPHIVGLMRCVLLLVALDRAHSCTKVAIVLMLMMVPIMDPITPSSV